MTPSIDHKFSQYSRLQWIRGSDANGKASATLRPTVPAKGRIPRISRIMALAIRMDGLVREGIAADYADLARLVRSVDDKTDCIHKTLLNEFYRVTFRKKIYNTIDELQEDLDTWLDDYNTQRPHSGKYCFGKTPLQTLHRFNPTGSGKARGLHLTGIGVDA